MAADGCLYELPQAHSQEACPRDHHVGLRSTENERLHGTGHHSPRK